MSLSDRALQKDRSWFGVGTVTDAGNEYICTKNLSSEIELLEVPGTSRTWTFVTDLVSTRARFGRTL